MIWCEERHNPHLGHNVLDSKLVHNNNASTSGRASNDLIIFSVIQYAKI